MYESSTCFGKKMACFGNVCEHKVEPQPAKPFLRSDSKTERHCKFQKTKMVADLPTQTIAIGSDGPCLAKDKTCYMPTGTLTWLEKEDHGCPYEVVMLAFMYRHKNVLATWSNNGNPTTSLIHGLTKEASVVRKFSDIYLKDEERPNILLQIKSKNLTSCSPHSTRLSSPIELWLTTQGLLVTQDARVRQFPTAKPSDSLERQIQLADGDLNSYIEHEQRIENEDLMWDIHCKQLQYNIQLMFNANKKFFRLYPNNEELILYANNGVLYLPKCELVTSISFVDNLENCYEDVPIRLANQSVAFLKQGKFIVHESRLVSCGVVNSQTNIADKIIVSVKGNRVTLQPLSPRHTYVIRPIHLKHSNLNYDHDPILTANFDVLGSQERSESVFDKGETFQVINTLRNNQNNHTINELLGHIFSSYQQKVMTLVICISLIMLIILSIVCNVPCYFARLFDCRREKTKIYGMETECADGNTYGFQNMQILS
jgi:hypothetical protein